MGHLHVGQGSSWYRDCEGFLLHPCRKYKHLRSVIGFTTRLRKIVLGKTVRFRLPEGATQAISRLRMTQEL